MGRCEKNVAVVREAEKSIVIRNNVAKLWAAGEPLNVVKRIGAWVSAGSLRAGESTEKQEQLV